MKFSSAAAILLFSLVFLPSCDSGPTVPDVKPTPAATAKPTPSELDLSGDYNVEGLDETLSKPYEGVLAIRNQGDGYRFNWTMSRARPAGTGVQMGDAVAVSFADPTNARGCGVVVYRIASDGSLDGKVANYAEYTFGSEKATRVEGKNFDGKYKLTGTAADGSAYEGTLQTEKNGNGYVFTWLTNRKNYVGFGILRGDRAAVGFGGMQCSFALYKVMSRLSLEGHWGSQRTVTFGTENAKR